MKPDELPTTVEELQRLLISAQGRADHERRRAEVAEQQTLELTATIDKQQQQLARKQRTIQELLQALRGKQRERVDPAQLVLFDIGELESFIEEQLAEDEKPSRRKSKRRNGRRLIPDDLPREEVLHEVPEEERLCPIDGQPMPRIRWEISEQLEYRPGRMVVLVHKRAVYACPAKHDEATLITAPKPPQPIDKGLAGPGLLSYVTVGKFGDHLPGYRLEDIFSRHGIEIRRSTIYDWFAGVAEAVRPLYELMKQRVLSSRIIHTDDTQVKLIDKANNSTRLARYWAYIGDRRNPYSVYDFTRTRERAGPAEFLDGFRGYLQADAYGGYDGIYTGSDGAIIEVACWTHARRYWQKSCESDPVRAHHVLAVISRLYEIERAVKAAQAETVQRFREEHAVPLLADLKQWLDAEVFLPRSVIGKAATYTLNQWEALNRYVEDGELSIDNNLSERTVKPVAIGRKNWLFVGSVAAGDRGAMLLSMVASCKGNRVEPWAWLKDVLTKLPAGASPESLLPDVWLEANPEHRWTIADRRAEERQRKDYL